ncbi:SAM-dependent methyltransferase [Marinobacterium jannaschii]|uniref:SAM-dependent methyltransferase n=1 Tax=Marinobacterium jannaschii TaxID=64970 RepID=UPI0005619E30|nr:cyclopropane-fatty-acyl-phospholipid synthase family protein [Marinobacterium jannaschii]
MKPADYSADFSQNALPESSHWLDKLCLNLLRRVLPRLTEGSLRLSFPNGQQLQVGDLSQPHAEVRLHSYRALRRFLFGGLVGWAESYMADEWDSPDITVLVQWALENERALSGLGRASALGRLRDRLVHRLRANSRRGSKRNIAYHYDLGNHFYRRWLDQSMTYSSALFSHPEQDLLAAQQNKFDRIGELLALLPDARLLEIGCGWGGFARHILQQRPDIRLQGITLSKEQLQWATQQLQQSGLSERGQLKLQDYRDLQGQYDAIASIEMFEAVGESHWPGYFETLKRCLKPGGRAVLQIITIDDQRFDRYRLQTDFIQRYIFPGGMLPSVKVLRQQVADAGFELEHQQMFGQDYARTLEIWRQAFLQQWPEIERQGFDERFRRMWLYYLGYCEGGFRSGSIDVGFFVLKAPDC